mgnify:CR=1 FL=1
MPRDRQNLLAATGLDGLADAVRRESLRARAVVSARTRARWQARSERRLDDRRLGSPFGGLPQALVAPARSRVDSWLATLAFASDEALRARLRAAAGADRAAAALERRDDSRLLVYDRATWRGAAAPRFRELADELAAGRARGRQRHARRARRGSGSTQPRGEVLLLERSGGRALGGARPSDASGCGREALRPVELLEHLGEGRWRLRLDGEPGGRGAAAAVHHRAARRSGALPDRLRATTRARPRRRRPGSHFTPELLARLDVERVTLHVGLDTFRPVTADDARRARATRRALRGARRRRGSGSALAPTGARRRHDDGARARDARTRTRRSRAAPISSSRPASSSGASTRC